MPGRLKHLLPTLPWGIAPLLLLPPAGADYYIYKEKDGTRWYTDRHLPSDEYTLIATVGRPTASASCTGVTDTIMAQRASTHVSIIEQYARIYGVDARLIKAIINVESCFDPYAVSRVGAKDLIQLMPAIAQLMGVHNVFDANDNIRGGVRYFSEMLKRCGQNVELALAAYNAGPEAVEDTKAYRPTRKCGITSSGC